MAASGSSSSSSNTSAPLQGDAGQGAASAVPISMYPAGAAAAAAAQSGSTSGSRLSRGTSFRIPLPPNSPNIGSSSATGNGSGSGTPGAGGFASPPLGHPASPGAAGAAFQPGSFTGSTNSTSSRFGGLVQGFRRNRGHSTNRGDLASPSSGLIGVGPGNVGNAPLPSPPASASFPQLTTSGSLNDIVPSATSPYFEGGADAGGSQSQQYVQQQQQQQQQQQAGGRGYFSRRGFGRKNTGGFLGGAGAGGQRTPTGEAPPPMLRSRSSSQPTVPAGHPHAGSAGGNSSSPFFPQSAALARPATASSPLQERSDPLAASTATAVRPAPAGEPSAAGAAAAATPTAGTSSAATAPTAASSSSTQQQQQHIRLVPHLESSRSLTFDPVSRDVAPTIPLRIGRFTERNPNVPTSSIDQNRVAFKSKVVSRTHAEIWYDPSPPAAAPATTGTGPAGWFIRDLKSSSGTFLNHIRLSGAGMESRPFNLRDGDVLQLGVDYQGGTEEIYRCVKMRVELNRGWQRGVNSFNSNALAQIRAFGNVAEGKPEEKDKTKKKRRKKEASAGNTGGDLEPAEAKPAAASAPAPTGAPSGGVTDCCICLFSVTVYQALFIAPCSHIFHFKCIRPLVEMHHPGFSCPLCRTFADLEADVEQDDVAEPIEAADSSSEGSEDDEDEDDGMEVGEAAVLPPELSAEAGPSSSAQLEVNLDTLRPGKRSPQIASISQFGQSTESSGQSTARGSSEVARPPTSTSPVPSRPVSGRRTPSSASRRSSMRASMDRGDTPSRAMGFSSPVSGAPGIGNGSGNGGADDSFFPPSAGDFQHDVRRSSIFVQGADGLPMQIPVTGRSRPGSLYEADASDGNISIASASASGSGPGALSERNRARSSRSLRMSTTSITSLREVMASQQSQLDQRPLSPDTPRRPRQSHPGGLTPTGPSTPSHEQQRQPDGASQGHAERAQNVTEYHDFDDADADMSPPPTARPDGDIHSFASPTTAEADGSPTSMFTAPLPGSSQPSSSVGLGGVSILGSSSATAALPDAADEQGDSDSSGSVPGASGVSQTQGVNAELTDKKGKGRQISEEAGTLPGGLENLAIGEVDGAGHFGVEKTGASVGTMPPSESTTAS